MRNCRVKLAAKRLIPATALVAALARTKHINNCIANSLLVSLIRSVLLRLEPVGVTSLTDE